MAENNQKSKRKMNSIQPLFFNDTPRTEIYTVSTKNFYAITPYNWSSYYALAVIELGQKISKTMNK